MGGYYARSFGPVTLIHPRHAGTSENWEGHERVHYEQLKRNWLHPFMYNFSYEYRLECEAEAYGWQVRNGHLLLQDAIDYMLDGRYGFRFRSKVQALQCLNKYIG